MDIGQLDKSEGNNEDVNAVQRRQHCRFSQKPKQESDNERKPPTVKLLIRHHQDLVNQPHETRNRGSMRRTRTRAGRSVSCATGAVARAMPPGFAHLRTIVKTWTELEQSHPAMPTVTYLAWIP